MYHFFCLLVYVSQTCDLLSYEKSGSKPLYMDYCKMGNSVRRDVKKKKTKEGYIQVTKLKKIKNALVHSSKQKDNGGVVLKWLKLSQFI